MVLYLMLLLLSCQPSYEVDVFIKGAQVYDGSENLPFKADVGIKGDRIAWIAADTSVRARKTILADGYLLIPGFIDPHTHSLRDLFSENRKSNVNYLTQGVTTVVNGNDGNGRFDLAETFDSLMQKGIGTNAAFMAPHGTIRKLVMGMDDRVPTSEEMSNMGTLVRKCMEEGALGLSAGLFYAPGSFSQTEEVIELAKIAAEYGGLYDVHIRDESSYSVGLINAIRETIEIGEKGGLPANISHIKCLGADVWGLSDSIVAIVDSARAAGLAVTADQYPFEASSTSFSAALLPRWVVANDPDFLPRLSNDTLLPRIREGIAENLRRRGGAPTILLTRPTDTTLTKLTLAKIAEQWNMDAVQAAIEIIKSGGSSIASFNMQEYDIETYMRQPWVMTCSDGGSPHPRKYATYTNKMVKYVNSRQIISMEDMIRRSTGMVADVFGIPDRGYIRQGYFADIALFKPEELKVHSTFADPVNLSEGMHYVLVNGVIAIEAGQYTGVLAGQPVTRKKE